MIFGRIASAVLLGATLGFAVTTSGQVGASRTALATVVDGRGRPVLDIDPDDFVIRETGKSREVLSVRVADYPIALVLDNGSAGVQDFPTVLEAAARFVGRVGRRPIAVALTAPPELVATLDDDRASVLDRIGMARPNGPTVGLLEGIVLAARALAASESPFSVIVVVSSSPSDSVAGAVLAPVLESGAAVHVIVNAALQGPGAMAGMLRSVADQTGGQFTPIYAAASYAAALDRLADRLAPQLMVEYVVPVGSSSGNDVQLGVKIPGARVIGLGVK
jgi:hypothetical protein